VASGYKSSNAQLDETLIKTEQKLNPVWVSSPSFDLIHQDVVALHKELCIHLTPWCSQAATGYYTLVHCLDANKFHLGASGETRSTLFGCMQVKEDCG
jgi:hypothetical protein